jgi:hypothetical protein
MDVLPGGLVVRTRFGALCYLTAGGVPHSSDFDHSLDALPASDKLRDVAFWMSASFWFAGVA